MKRTSNKPLLYSLTSLVVLSSSVAYAETRVTAPTLEGGFTGSIGAIYLSPSSDDQNYAGTYADVENTTTTEVIAENIVEVNPGYDFGVQASLGYLFEDTANGLEFFYRVINTSDSDNVSSDANTIVFIPQFDDEVLSASSDLSYELNAVDLMFNQFMDIGDVVQMRFSLGASYLNLEKDQTSYYVGFEGGLEEELLALDYASDSQFSGFGPRFSTDARYEFGPGFGLLGGASLAYYIGDMDVRDTFIAEAIVNPGLKQNTEKDTQNYNDDLNNHAVTNLRANIGIDYVYFFDDEEGYTFGIELGYLVDYYADATQKLNYISDNAHEARNIERAEAIYTDSDSNSITFSGPYLNIKSVF